MGGDASWVVTEFLPNQKLPDGYVIGGEWGELNGYGEVGFGCWYWHKRDTDEFGPPFRTRWEARRSAIEHARQKGD